MNKDLSKTNKILQEVDKKFIERFSGAKEEFFNNDWVDIALVCIDNKENKLYFSSANRKLCIVDSENQAQLLVGSPYPIGGWQVEKERKFESCSFSFKKGDCMYLGSDGFQDQINRPKNKKFSSKRLHKLLSDLKGFALEEQYTHLENQLKDWKGANDQIDDICIVGIRL